MPGRSPSGIGRYRKRANAWKRLFEIFRVAREEVRNEPAMLLRQRFIVGCACDNRPTDFRYGGFRAVFGVGEKYKLAVHYDASSCPNALRALSLRVALT